MSGSEAGQRWEIDEANTTATSLALLPSDPRSTKTTVPTDLVNDVVSIRPHWRISDIFPTSTFRATTNPATSDQALFWDPTTNGYVTLWLANFFGQKHWRLISSANLFTNSDDRSVDPAEGLFIHPRLAISNNLVIGQVRTWRFAMPLKAGPNFFGNPYPTAQSPVAWGMSSGNGFSASSNTKLADQLYFWTGDSSTYQNFSSYQFYRKGQTTLWKITSSTDLTTNYGLQNLFQSCHSTFINSISGNASWSIPAPVIAP